MIEEIYKKYIECGYRVTTDSRAIKGGEIFFALKGENFDGNKFASQALADGAKYAVVLKGSQETSNPAFIEVEDTFEALRALAIHHREQLSIPVIGLTGTNGKTTTKELIRSVLEKKFDVCATQGNLNNDIGVPLSVLKITDKTQIAVIEMGASHPDDIAKLVKVSQPDFGLITNVGKAHLLGFGSFDGVKKAKGELYKYLSSREGSTVFINADDPDLREMSADVKSHIWEYGIRYQGVEVLPSSAEAPFLRLILDGKTVCTNLVGSYNATNVLAAVAVGAFFGVSKEDAISAIEAYVPVNNRSQMVKTEKNTLVVDAYNANPSSMSAALDNFALVQSAHKLALLGEMRELGKDSVAEHRTIVRKAIEAGYKTIFVGEEFKKAEAPVVFATSDELRDYLAAHPVEGATILVKGSRGVQMEKVLPVL